MKETLKGWSGLYRFLVKMGVVFDFWANMLSYSSMYLACFHSKIYRLVLKPPSQSHSVMFRKHIIHITSCHAFDYSDRSCFSTYLFSPRTPILSQARYVPTLLYSCLKLPSGIRKKPQLGFTFPFSLTTCLIIFE